MYLLVVDGVLFALPSAEVAAESYALAHCENEYYAQRIASYTQPAGEKEAFPGKWHCYNILPINFQGGCSPMRFEGVFNVKVKNIRNTGPC